jgi:hypothetical protein
VNLDFDHHPGLGKDPAILISDLDCEMRRSLEISVQQVEAYLVGEKVLPVAGLNVVERHATPNTKRAPVFHTSENIYLLVGNGRLAGQNQLVSIA